MNIENYYISKESENSIWEAACFVFDSSTLLNLYEFSDTMVEEIFTSTFDKLKDQIFLPFHVLYELEKNKKKSTGQKIEKYKDLDAHLIQINNHFSQIQNKTKTDEKHPHLEKGDIETFAFELKTFSDSFDLKINGKIEHLKNDAKNDKVFKYIQANFTKLEPLTYSEKIAIIKEGEFRYRNRIPPGYKDDDKDGFQLYADLIIWKEALKHIGQVKKPLIFIVDDLKEDWWVLEKKNKPLNPREELVEEVFEVSGKELLMYSLSQFLSASNEILNSNVKDETIEVAKGLRILGNIDLNKIPNWVRLTATNSETELHRIDRLEELLEYINKVCDQNELRKISRFNDHKGDLTVYWNSEPSDSEKLLVESGWEAQHELALNVIHIVKRN